MPRPTNRATLLELSEANLRKLLEFVDALPDEHRVSPSSRWPSVPTQRHPRATSVRAISRQHHPGRRAAPH